MLRGLRKLVAMRRQTLMDNVCPGVFSDAIASHLYMGRMPVLLSNNHRFAMSTAIGKSDAAVLQHSKMRCALSKASKTLKHGSLLQRVRAT